MNARLLLPALAAAVLCSCGNKSEDYDATGLFEATEVTVSAQQNGLIMSLDLREGDMVTEGQQVGLIDTVQLYLKALQIGATKDVYSAQRPEIKKQVASVKEQLEKARMERERFRKLVESGAANRKQLEDAESQVNVLEKQLDALESQLNVSTRSLNAQIGAADVQKLQVLDQLEKCRVTSPISGTVLEKYAEAGEYATVAKPLFKVADTDNMFLRAYVSSKLLSELQTGQKVTVYSDYGKGTQKEYEGTLTWISSKAEFTPKTILSDDERADLVYAVKVAVKNDGLLKIGMYGEVKF